MDTTTGLATAVALEKTVENLLSQQKITFKDIESLNPAERQFLGEAATAILGELQGTERDDFLEKVDLIINEVTRSETWEYNHAAIHNAITDFTQRYGYMPSKTKIAQLSNLSRSTINKHLKEYQQHPGFNEVAEQFKFMSHRVLAGVFKYATNGDMRAARLYFEMTGELNKRQSSTVVNSQNNYIQINNTILSQENIKQLSTEQLNQIENIVMESVKLKA